MKYIKDQYVEKLKELVEVLYCELEIYVSPGFMKPHNGYNESMEVISALESKISALEQQTKEGEVSYQREFVEWIISSRMAFDLIFFNKTTPELFDYWQSKVKLNNSKT